MRTRRISSQEPHCRGAFLANPAALEKISSNWEQGQYLEKGGWAIRRGVETKAAAVHAEIVVFDSYPAGTDFRPSVR